mgnify:CR=1 FL=1
MLRCVLRLSCRCSSRRTYVCERRLLNGHFAPGSFRVEVGRGRHGRVVISWAPGEEGTEWTDEGGHMWKLREDRALDLSCALIATLARNASCAGADVPA